MQYNFFQWLRDGVRQSVLLGVSDAVEAIGVPHDANESNEKLQRTLGIAARNENVARLSAEAPGAVTKRSTGTTRRLGKSLKDLGTVNPS
ncbi:MAG TPA: hypothetical protein VGN57_05645 [Pirellulaceae bacterium]|nr:hypothetical protein [Pirellulaceae bacterium]